MLPLCIVLLVVSFDLTSSVNWSDVISIIDETSSLYEDGDMIRSLYEDDWDSSLLEQEIIDSANEKCATFREANDLVGFLTSLVNDLAEASVTKMIEIDDAAAEAELEEIQLWSKKVQNLKNEVKETASKANCPTPDDPSLMGELDVILDLVYEICFIHHIDNAEQNRSNISQRLENLLDDILLYGNSIPGSSDVDQNEVCTKIIKECETALNEVKSYQKKYDLQLRSIYNSCSHVAYAEAVKFLPSVIQRATSCRTMNLGN